MVITIASGKGGTGKTTIATNLAASISTPVQLVDCDVDEPNDHIFFEFGQKRSYPVYRKVPQLDSSASSACSLCGTCEQICQFSAITVVGDTLMTFPDMCHSCMGCIMACPNNCLKPADRLIGEVISGSSGHLELTYGILRIGEAMSPALIEEVKQNFNPTKIIIVDSPPGTSCPVVTTLLDSDFIVLVTEPTPFGLNDLTLIVETVKQLNIPFGIIINRSDIGNDAIEKYAAAEGIPILLSIKNQRSLAEMYSRGEIVSTDREDMRKIFQDLYQKISQLLKKQKCIN